ncbi:MAG: hypothetical protein NTY61_03050 [Candidatus Parcubacteria bacterium]|nr:hypothetical protein [Candidatus Parcubacteria bacterium]
MKSLKKTSIIVSCIDYRFWPQALPLLKNKYGNFDLIGIAGSSRGLISPTDKEDGRVIIKNIKTSIRLHHSYQLILTNHIDCGAYGGSKNFSSQAEEAKFHKKELRAAKAIIQEKFPQLMIKTELLIINNGKVRLL